jgi:anti-sigma factor RsiW
VGSSDDYALWDAAYVLGSLSDPDRREYEAHLHTCPSCREAVAELADMPALLGQLTLDQVASIDDGGSDVTPPLNPHVLTSLLAEVSRRRRNSRLVTWTVAAAAAAVLVIGVLVGVQPRSTTPLQAEAPALAMTPVAPTELAATVTITGQGWGTHIDMNCTYGAGPSTAAPDGNEHGDKLAMVVVGRDGSHDRLATWMALKGAIATPGGSTAMPIDQIATVQIISADTGNVLLQRSL